MTWQKGLTARQVARVMREVGNDNGGNLRHLSRAELAAAYAAKASALYASQDVTA